MKIVSRRLSQPGKSPGMLVVAEGLARPAQIRIMHYTSEALEEKEVESVEELFPYIGLPGVLWIDVIGLYDVPILEKLGEKLGLHQLALEDVLHTGQRPKVEDYDGHEFIVVKQLRFLEGHLESEQISIFLGEHFVLTLKETPQDDWDPVRHRIRSGSGRIRGSKSDYLAYALVDFVIDSFFPLLEAYGDRIEELQRVLLEQPNQKVLERIHAINRELIMVRRAAWPHREVANALQRSESNLLKKGTRVFLRDCYDHTVQILDILESYRDLARGLMDLYLSTVSNRMNEVMKMLTVMASIFIPLTFLAGIYGMNFDPEAGPLSMPELGWAWGYAAFWVVIVSIAGGMIAFFKRKNWW